jgi:hypothetical protein
MTTPKDTAGCSNATVCSSCGKDCGESDPKLWLFRESVQYDWQPGLSVCDRCVLRRRRWMFWFGWTRVSTHLHHLLHFDYSTIRECDDGKALLEIMYVYSPLPWWKRVWLFRVKGPIQMWWYTK